jgi:hypothetical protein
MWYDWINELVCFRGLVQGCLAFQIAEQSLVRGFASGPAVRLLGIPVN